MNWQLEFALHMPHDRFALGWEYIGATDKENINTFTLYLLVLTVHLHVFGKEDE